MGNRYYLAIGIDEYPGTKKLNNAVGDVYRISVILEEKYGFTPVRKPLLDKEATRENILIELNNLCTFIGPNDDLIIYYAGHGNKAPTSNAGYWEPVDFDPAKVYTRIDNSSVLDFIEGIDARHILLISDSCFSGTFLERKRSGTKPTDHDALDELKSGWILVSGGLENVGDGVKGKGSPFSQTLCRALQNNTKPSMSAGELFDEVIRVMTVNAQQTPEAAPIRSINEGGEMIFRLRKDLPDESPEFATPTIALEHAYLTRTLTSYSEERPTVSFFYEPEVGKVVVDDLVTTQKKIVILGGAGSGKSIELTKTMERIKASNKGLVPVFRRLNNYTAGDLDQYLPQQWKQVSSNRLVIFLDGLDEIQPQFVNTALRKIADFGERHPDATMVISCRTNFYELPTKNYSGTLTDFQVYLLNDVSLATIRDYVQTIGLDGNEFIKEVQKWGYLDLIQKPYFLNILLNFFQKNKTLEVRRSDVLNDALERYIEATKEHYKNADLKLNYKQLINVAERIAFVMELMGKNYIIDDEINQVVKNDDEYRSLRYLPAFRYDQEKEQWYFEHNNIQEYLASRVLKRQDFDKMIDVLSLSSLGIHKIKPTWVNTLSFMVSIGDDLEIKSILDWLIKNEPEILVRFEPDRLPLATRIDLFKQIVQHYNYLQIWLSSNKFSDLELARFAQSEETLDYLLKIFEEKQATRIGMLNAAHLLRKFQIRNYPQFAERAKNALLKALTRPEFSESDQYTIICAMAELGFSDRDTINLLIEKFGQRENQYLRAGLYKIINSAGEQDAFVDLFLEGIKMTRFHYRSKDRTMVTLMDEDHQLKAGIAKLQSPESIRKVLEVVSVDVSSVLQFFVDFKDEMMGILDHIFTAYDQDPSLFPLLAVFFAREAMEGRSERVWEIVNRIDERNIRWEVMQFVLTGKDLREYEIFSAAAALVNEATIEQLFTQYKKGTIDKELLLKIYNTVQWRQTALPDYHQRLNLFRKMLVEVAGMEFPEEPVIDRAALLKIKAQQGFDELFDKDALIAQVEVVYQFLGLDVVSHNDLYGYKHGEYVDISERFSSTTAELFRHFTYGNAAISKQVFLDWIKKSGQFKEFQIQTIKARLSNLPELDVSEAQTKFIDDWVKSQNTVNSYTWYFINKFKIGLSADRYLDFTRYFSPSDEKEPQQKGFIEVLEAFLTRSKLVSEVEANINRDDLPPMVWLSNAAYALRNNLKSTYNRIIDYLAKVDEAEQRFADLLKCWFEKTRENGGLIHVVENATNDYIRNEALRQLLDSGEANDYLKGYYLSQMKSDQTGEPNKIHAANKLILLGIPEGFEYLAKQFLADPSPDIEFRHFFKNITNLKDVNEIGFLTEMLFYAKQPEFKRDMFDDLEPMIQETLFNIGMQSREHFKAVKEALQDFIKRFQGEIEHIHFLDFTITKIEDQLNMKMSREFSLAEAVGMLKGLK